MAKIHNVVFEIAASLKGSFNNAFGGANKQIQKLSTHISELSNNHKLVNNFKEMQGGIQNTSNALTQAQSKVKEFQNEINRANQAKQVLAPKLQAAEFKVSSITKAKEEVDKLQAEIEQTTNPSEELISKLKAAKVGARGISAAKEEVRKLQAEIKQTATPSKQLISQFNQAQASAGRLNQQLTNQRQNLGQVRSAIQQAGMSTQNLTQQNAKLAKQIMSTQQAQAKLVASISAQKAAQAKLSEIKGQIFDTAAMTAAASAPLIAFAELEDSATRLKATFTDATGKVAPEFEQVNKLAIELGNQLPGSTADFQNMFNVLKRQGLSSQSILGGTGKAAAYLAVQLKLPFEQAANMAANLQDATGTAEKDMMSFMDTIQKAYHVGVESNDMVQGFSKLSPALMMAKQRGAEGAKAFAPLLAMLTQTGMAGESAGNALRKVIQSPFTNTKALKDIQKEYKIDLKFNTDKGEFGGLQNMFTQLAKLKKLSTADRTNILSDLFGNDAEVQTTVVTLIEKGQAGYDEMNKKMQDQADLQTRVETQLGTLTNMWDSLKGTATNALASIGAPLASSLKPTITQLNNFIGNTLQPFMEKHQQLIGVIGKVALGMIAFKTASLATGFVFQYFKGIMLGVNVAVTAGRVAWGLYAGTQTLASVATGKFGLVSKAAAAAQWVLNAAMTANPVGLMIAGVVALGAALYVIIKYWDDIVKGMNSAGAAVKKFLGFDKVDSKTVTPMIGVPGGYGAYNSFANNDKPVNIGATNQKIAQLQNTKNTSNQQTINYSPTINVTGGADKNMVQQANKTAQADFDKQIKQHQSQKSRVAY